MESSPNGPLNGPTKIPNKRVERLQEDAVSKSRRNFLKGVGIAALAGLGVAKLVQEKNKIDAFNEEYGPDASIEDFTKLSMACQLLRQEIAVYDTSTDIIINKSINLSRIAHSTERIDILGGYLLRYFTSKVSKDNPLRKIILERGTITVNDLDILAEYFKKTPKISY